MKLKLTLPEHIGDITLNQYQRYEKLQTRLKDEEITLREFNKLKLNLFAGVPYRSIEDIKQKDIEDLMLQIDTAIGQDCKFESRFTLNGVEYGFIPNLDEINNAEYFDLNKYGAEVETLHNLMAILFRPIKNKDSFKNYTIKKYKGTGKYADTMKETPMNIVNGALVFFSSLSNELQKHIQRSTREEQARVQKQPTISASGVGTALS
jgi:hypothetical protein